MAERGKFVWDSFASENSTISIPDQIDDIVSLVSLVLPEKYSRLTYCYFLYSWPWLCHMVWWCDKYLT